MKSSSALLLLGLCGGVGWVLGSFSRPVPPTIHTSLINSPQTADQSAADLANTTAASGSGALARLTGFGIGGMESSELEARVFDVLEALPITELGNVVLGLASSTDRKISYLDRHVFIYWAGRDFTTAREWLVKLPEAKRAAYSNDLAEAWGKKDPDQFMDWIEALSPSLKSSVFKQCVYTLIHATGDRAPERILTTILSLPEKEPNQIHNLFAAWGRHAPQNAATRARLLPSGELQSAAVTAAVSAWAEKDPAGASKFLASLGDPVLGQKAQSAFITGLASKDPAAAISALSDLPLTVESKNAVSTVVAKWTRKDSEGALRWADQLSEEDTARKVYTTILQTLAGLDLDKATAAVTARPQKLLHNEAALQSLMGAAQRRHGLDKMATYLAGLPQELQTCASVAFTNYLSNRTAPELETWIDLQREGPARQAGMKKLTGSKFQKDPEKALQWVQSLAAGESRDIAAGEMVNQTFYQSADRGADLARLLQPAATAEKTIEERIQRWLYQDEKSAGAWIKKTEKLSGDQKRKLLAAP